MLKNAIGRDSQGMLAMIRFVTEKTNPATTNFFLPRKNPALTGAEEKEFRF